MAAPALGQSTGKISDLSDISQSKFVILNAGNAGERAILGAEASMRPLLALLSQRERRGEWVALKADTNTHLGLQDLDLVPEK
ncbi:hypothetical protein PQR34_47870 [Paraburkholderia sediminicola]|uniref:hypothetical protein n=1 Tax=Paraburkholderia sediminicola TaxID=458836 RepID=UPI0038BC702E